MPNIDQILARARIRIELRASATGPRNVQSAFRARYFPHKHCDSIYDRCFSFHTHTQPHTQFLDIGIVTSIECNHKQVESARKGQEVCIKIEPIPGESPKMYGRHFEETDILTSKVSASNRRIRIRVEFNVLETAVYYCTLKNMLQHVCTCRRDQPA